MATIGSFDMSYLIVRCNKCGFYYAKQLSDSNTYNCYYQSVSKYDSLNSFSPIDQTRVDLAVQFLNSRVSKNSNILDIGCGMGSLLAALKNTGWNNLQGIDPAPNAAKIGLGTYGLNDITIGNISNAHEVINFKKLDVVCIMSVLEHLLNLNKDLKQLFNHLNIGCKILVEVPAIEFFPNLRNEPYGEFSLEHIQYFDKNSLCNLMKSLGAIPLAVELIELPIAASGIIMGLFEWRGCPPINPVYNYLHTEKMEIYREQSQEKLNLALTKIPHDPLIIYGAGSHTARLIKIFENLKKFSIHTIVDNNPNLIGKKIGKWTVQPTSIISHSPEIPVLVSSFRSQNAIATALQETVPNPIVLMYQ